MSIIGVAQRKDEGLSALGLGRSVIDAASAALSTLRNATGIAMTEA